MIATKTWNDKALCRKNFNFPSWSLLQIAKLFGNCVFGTTVHLR